MTSMTESLSRVRVSRVEQVADGFFSFELRDVHGVELPPFTAGGHISIRSPSGLVRSYSLCNDPAERDRYVITIKREEHGKGGSKDLTDHVHAGDTVEISHPRNLFALVPNAKKFIFIAGGIGITPIMAMMRHLNARGDIPYRTYYLSRTPEVTPFLDELKSPDFGGQVLIHHDRGDPAQAYDLWKVLEKPAAQTHVYCCGPLPLMDAVRDMSGHWPDTAIHFEAFTNPDALPRADDTAFTVRLASSDQTLDVAADVSILNTLRKAGVRVPASCESGTCGSCRTGLLGGEADHRDMVLMSEERDTQIMVCVSRAKSAELILDL